MAVRSGLALSGWSNGRGNDGETLAELLHGGPVTVEELHRISDVLIFEQRRPGPKFLKFSILLLLASGIATFGPGCPTHRQGPLQQNGSQLMGWTGNRESLGLSHQSRSQWIPRPISRLTCWCCWPGWWRVCY